MEVCSVGAFGALMWSFLNTRLGLMAKTAVRITGNFDMNEI